MLEYTCTAIFYGKPGIWGGSPHSAPNSLNTRFSENNYALDLQALFLVIQLVARLSCLALNIDNDYSSRTQLVPTALQHFTLAYTAAVFCEAGVAVGLFVVEHHRHEACHHLGAFTAKARGSALSRSRRTSWHPTWEHLRPQFFVHFARERPRALRPTSTASSRSCWHAGHRRKFFSCLCLFDEIDFCICGYWSQI